MAPDKPVTFWSIEPGANNVYFVLMPSGGTGSFLWGDAVLIIRRGLTPWVHRWLIQPGFLGPAFLFSVFENGGKVIGVGEMRRGPPPPPDGLGGRCVG